MICSLCDMDHANTGQMFTCIETLRRSLLTLLSNVGMKGECKGCGAEIIWVRHMNGKSTPYNSHGYNHFIDCPKAKDFKK